METLNIKNESKGFLSLGEVFKELKTRPKPKYLWAGIRDKSFGLVFGPAKSGKTIFCENLAMSIAIGRQDFFGYKLDGVPKKVLFIGLEEFWAERAERNRKQFSYLNEQEQTLLESNYYFQSLDYDKHIVKKEDYVKLEKIIEGSKAEVVFIDSITRMNSGKLENSDTAEKIMQQLREVCQDKQITLICIHHTPKMEDCPITMDKIKGSAVFAQESDFAIGINRTTKKNRYLKEIFYRYASDDIDTVKEFIIDDSMWLDFVEDVEEDSILKRTDGRRDDKSREEIKGYINSSTSLTYETNELVDKFEDDLGIKERRIKYILSDLTKKDEIGRLSRGVYCSINKQKKEGNGEGV